MTPEQADDHYSEHGTASVQDVWLANRPHAEVGAPPAAAEVAHAFAALERFRTYGHGRWHVGAAIDVLREALSSVATGREDGASAAPIPTEQTGGSAAQWQRADSAGQVMLYSLRQDGWRKGQPVMVNDISVTIRADNGSITPLEPIVSAVSAALSTSQPGTQPEGRSAQPSSTDRAEIVRDHLKSAIRASRGWPPDLHPGPATDAVLAALAALSAQPPNTDRAELLNELQHYVDEHVRDKPSEDQCWEERLIVQALAALKDKSQ